MPSDIPADVSYIGGVWCEGVLYGIHLVVFSFICIIYLDNFYHKTGRIRGGPTTSAILLAVSTCMFALSTAHVGLAVQSLLDGFIYRKSEGSDVFFRENVFPNRKAIYIINTLLGDSLLVWRAYVLWQMRWEIYIIPILFLLGTTACGIKTIVSNVALSHSSVFDPSILSWVTSMFALTIATQFTATALIAYRIWRTFNVASLQSRARYTSLVWLLVESGAIYTSTAVIQLVTEVLGMNAGVIMEFMLAQLCAIAPGLIVVRITLGSAFGSSSRKRNSTNSVVQLTTFHATANHVKSVEDTLGSHTIRGTVSQEEDIRPKQDVP